MDGTDPRTCYRSETLNLIFQLFECQVSPSTKSFRLINEHGTWNPRRSFVLWSRLLVFSPHTSSFELIRLVANLKRRSTNTSLTIANKHLLSLTAPQQPKNPIKNNAAPTPIMMYTPSKIIGLVINISRNDPALTAAHIPTPSTAAPHIC